MPGLRSWRRWMSQYRWLCTVTMTFCLLCSATAKTLTYESPEVDCDWLDAEHERIQPDDRKNPPPPPVTKEGILMTTAMLVTLPLNILGSLFSERDQYDFSGDINDLKAAAQRKGCDELVRRIETRQREAATTTE